MRETVRAFGDKAEEGGKRKVTVVRKSSAHKEEMGHFTCHGCGKRYMLQKPFPPEYCLACGTRVVCHAETRIGSKPAATALPYWASKPAYGYEHRFADGGNRRSAHHVERFGNVDVEWSDWGARTHLRER